MSDPLSYDDMFPQNQSSLQGESGQAQAPRQYRTGRPRQAERAARKAKSVTLDPFVLLKLQELADDAGRTLSEQLNHLLLNHCSEISADEYMLWKQERESEWPAYREYLAEQEQTRRRIERAKLEAQITERVRAEERAKAEAQARAWWQAFEEGYTGKTQTPAGHFHGLHTEQEIRRRYRELCKTMHPDAGGSDDAFRDLTRQCEAALSAIGVTKRRAC